MKSQVSLLSPYVPSQIHLSSISVLQHALFHVFNMEHPSRYSIHNTGRYIQLTYHTILYIRNPHTFVTKFLLFHSCYYDRKKSVFLNVA